MNIIDNANCLTFDKETRNYRTFSIPVVISFFQLSTCESVFTVISISLLSRIACALAYLQIELLVSLFCLNIFFLYSYSFCANYSTTYFCIREFISCSLHFHEG